MAPGRGQWLEQIFSDVGLSRPKRGCIPHERGRVYELGCGCRHEVCPRGRLGRLRLQRHLILGDVTHAHSDHLRYPHRGDPGRRLRRTVRSEEWLTMFRALRGGTLDRRNVDGVHDHVLRNEAAWLWCPRAEYEHQPSEAVGK